MLDKIEDAIEDIKAGKVVIVVDDEDRENEGDFVAAAELITDEIVNFMARYGRGLICAPLSEKRCVELELDMMVGNNTSIHETPFTVSVDLLTQGCTSGISVADRAKTLRALANPKTDPAELGRPGHIFPLKARERGVLRRAGHTEAVVDLARLAGLQPAGVLVEIMNEDGTMARMPQLEVVAKQFGLRMISIADLIAYRIKTESIVEKGDRVKLPTDYGDFDIVVFKQLSNGLEHVAIIKGEWEPDEPILVRVHSSCVTGDIFGSSRCDCGSQLHAALRKIEEEGKGAVIYLNQEGRGIGLFNKIHAYKLQEEGMDTVEANEAMGFQPDERDYGVGANIMHQLGITHVRLMTNNASKKAGLEGFNIHIDELVPVIVPPNTHNLRYLRTKESKMGHRLGLCSKQG